MISSQLSSSKFFGVLWDSGSVDSTLHDEENDKTGSTSSEGTVTDSMESNLDSFLNRLTVVTNLWPLSISASEQTVGVHISQDDDVIPFAVLNHPGSALTNIQEDQIDYSGHADEEVQRIDHISLALNSSTDDLSWQLSGVRIPLNLIKSTTPPDTNQRITSVDFTVASTAAVDFHCSDERTILSPLDEGAANLACYQKSSELHPDLPSTFAACRKQSSTQDRSFHINPEDLSYSSSAFEGHYTGASITPLALQINHLSWFGHGKTTTLIPIALAIMALILSIFSRLSLRFVSLSEPLYVSTYFMKLDAVGLNRIRLCYNDSIVHGRMLTYIDDYNVVTASSTTIPLSTSRSAKVPGTGCNILELTTENVDDTMWDISRSCISFAVYLGSFLTIMLGTSIYWQSINLKPIAVGILVVYFFQSVSFFFFDSKLCREHICRLSEGSFASILSCVFWFASGLACIRMDIIYQSKLRRYERRRWQESKLQGSRETNCPAETDVETPLSTPISSPASLRVQMVEEEMTSQVNMTTSPPCHLISA